MTDTNGWDEVNEPGPTFPFEASGALAALMTVGESSLGYRRVVPIERDGRFEGPDYAVPRTAK